MALWSRLKQAKPKFNQFATELKRFYTLNHVQHNHLCSRTLIPAQNSANVDFYSKESPFLWHVRFYAAPVQATPKKEEKSSKPKLNDQITTPFLRLITEEGHSVLSRNEALARARNLKMDLVEVDKNAKPPVCKIMDYNKEKYLHKLKEKESKDRAKSKGIKQGAFKEIRFATKIKQNDLQMKADMARRLMESGHRVKCTAVDSTDAVELETLLSRFTSLIEDIACFECEPKVEKKQAYVVIRHLKFGPSKKGSGKKASKAAESTSSNSQPLNEVGDSMLPNLQTPDEELSDEDAQTSTNEWALSNRDGSFNTVFEVDDEATEPAYSKQAQPPFSADRSSNAASSTPNRYARDPRSVNPSRVPTNMDDRGARNRITAPPPLRTPQRFDIPARGVPEVSTHRSNLNSTTKRDLQAEVPACGVNGQDSSRPSTPPNSPTKSYGIFSTQVNNSQNGPAESNRYKKINPSESARGQSSIGVSPNNRSNTLDPFVNRRPGATDSERGRW